MTARPPRATTKSDARRPRARGATHGDKERPSKVRAASIVQTDQFERVLDDEIVESTDAPEVPQLRLVVLESATHLAAAQGAVVAAGHIVVLGASGRDGVDKLRHAVGDADALLVGLPGSEPLIEVALAHPRRPVVIAASTCSASDAVRRAVVVSADLAAVRPYDVEQLAPILLAAARLAEQRRQRAAASFATAEAALGDVLDGWLDPADSGELEHSGLVSLERLTDAAVRELERAQRNGYPLTVVLFSVEIEPPEPPAVLRGIVRARCGNTLVHALRDIDLATELEHARFLVLMPLTERHAGAEVARRIIGAVAAGDPVVAGGRTFPLKVIGAVVSAVAGEPRFDVLVSDVTQLLEQAQASGASLAVET